MADLKKKRILKKERDSKEIYTNISRWNYFNKDGLNRINIIIRF